MKLIDADEAFRVLSDYYHHRTEEQHDALHEALDRVPEAVVLCKDCKYYDYPFSAAPQESTDAENERWCCLLGMGGAFGKNDYCSHGERRTE